MGQMEQATKLHHLIKVEVNLEVEVKWTLCVANLFFGTCLLIVSQKQSIKV